MPRLLMCVVCNLRTATNTRRTFGESNMPEIRQFLERERNIICTPTDVIHRKCATRITKQISSQSTVSESQSSTSSRSAMYNLRDQEELSEQNINLEMTSTQSSSESSVSPFSSPVRRPAVERNIQIPLQSVSLNESECFICSSSVVRSRLSVIARSQAYIETGVFIPKGCRVCSEHLLNDVIHPNAMGAIRATNTFVSLSVKEFQFFMKSIRSAAKRRGEILDFDNEYALTDEDYEHLTGLTKEQFRTLCSSIPDSYSTYERSIRKILGIYLTKLKTANSNRVLATLFKCSSSTISRYCSQARRALDLHFKPRYFGFEHISREEVIAQHTRTLAKQLYASDQELAILIFDGTYFYHEKSTNFEYQRESYSLHKYRNLIKSMIVCTTTGYIITAIGPYIARDNDASIMNRILHDDIENIKQWLQEGDIIVVDR